MLPSGKLGKWKILPMVRTSDIPQGLVSVPVCGGDLQMTDYAVCPYCGSSSLTGRCNGYFCLSCMHFIDIDEVTE